MTTQDQPRSKKWVQGGAFCAAAALLIACGSDGGGNGITCGKGTRQKGNTCIPSSPDVEPDAGAGGTEGDGGSGGSAPQSGGASGGGAGGAPAAGAGGAGPADSGVVKDSIEFAGVTSAAPGNAESLEAKPPPADSIRLSWLPATYPGYPLASLKYEIYAATAAGMENFTAPIAEAPAGSTSFLVQGLDEQKMFFVVRAVSNQGSAVDNNVVELSATPSYDTKPPTFGGGVKVVSATSTSVTLSWKAGTDDKTPPEGLVYDVYWGTKSGTTPTLGAVSLPGETTATVDGLPAAKTEFFFRVVVMDAAGNVSTNKEDTGGKTGADKTPPLFGGCGSAVDPTAGGATVVWTPAVDDTTPPDKITYDVYAFEVPVTRDTPFDKLDPSATFVGGSQGEIKGLKNGTTYRVVCRAVDESGNQDENRVTQVFTTKLDGKAPTFAGANQDPGSYELDSTKVTIGWLEASDNISDASRISYYVYASTSSMGEDFTAPPLVKTDPGVLSTPVEGLLSNTQYYFVVRAVDEAGNIDQNVAELGLKTLVSFAGDVQPIFTANCAVTGCHVPGNPPQGQILSAGFAYSNIVDKAAGEAIEPDIKRIDSTNPDPLKSYLWRKVSGQGAIQGSPMPPLQNMDQTPSGRRPLNAGEQDTIKQWIQQGAKNN